MPPLRRVALVNPPSEDRCLRDLYCSLSTRGSYGWAPIDLLVLSASLKDRFELFALDAVAEDLSFEAAHRRASAFRPDAVVCLVGSATLQRDLLWVKGLKDATGARTILVGDVSLDQDRAVLSEAPWADALVHDFTSPGVARYLEDGAGRPGPLPGLTHRLDGRLVGSGPADLRSAGPFRYGVPRHDLFPLKRYRIPNGASSRMASILASFGCVYSCGYCVENRNVIAPRCRDLDDLGEELSRLREMGVDSLFFRDPIFGGTRQNALAVCGMMKRGGGRFSWSCNLRVEMTDEELIRGMGEAGCRAVAFGIETLNGRALGRYRQPVSPEAIRKVIGLCHERKMLAAGYFILGLPGETRASVEETIDFAVNSGLDFASFAVPAPDYATPLRREALGEGWVPSGHGDFDRGRPDKAVSPDLDPFELDRLFRGAYRRMYFRPAYVWKTIKRLRSVPQFLDAASNAHFLLRRILK